MSAGGARASPFIRMIATDPANTNTLYAATDAAATWNPTGLMAGPNDHSSCTAWCSIHPPPPPSTPEPPVAS